MCKRNEIPDVYADMVERWFNLNHDDAALAEGWCLTPCEGSEHGPLQVRRADEAAGIQAAWALPFAVPALASDSEAWALVRDGTQPHHRAARELLALFNLPALGRIALGAPSLVSLTLEHP